jgi:hypothetical protein
MNSTSFRQALNLALELSAADAPRSLTSYSRVSMAQPTLMLQKRGKPRSAAGSSSWTAGARKRSTRMKPWPGSNHV